MLSCQRVCESTQRAFLLQKKPVNEEEIGEPFARERSKVNLSAPKSQRFLRFAIAMPIADPRNRAISKARESNAALQFKAAMESR